MRTTFLNHPSAAWHSRLIARLHLAGKVWSSIAHGIAWPYLEFVIRVWIAKLFFSFGLLQLMQWQPTLLLADAENPIPFLPVVAAAITSTGIYLLCSVLLAVGFMTRYAVLPLLGLSLVTQLRYTPFDTQLFWVVLSGWLAVHGAGALSLDNLLRRGLSESALPFIPRLISASTRLRRWGTPLYLSLVRLWLAVALLTVVYSASHQLDLATLARWLPLDVATRLPLIVALVGGVLWIPGVATRITAAVLLVTFFGYSVMDPRATDSIYLLMCVGILGIHGGGAVAVDAAIGRWWRRGTRASNTAGAASLEGLPRVVIVGAGFGGLQCAQALRDVPVAVTLIDRTNYHLFQPLLYQVATAALSPGDIATPARQMFRTSPTTRLLLGTVTGIDTRSQTVLATSGNLPYDYLVLATGATHSYFGKETWSAYAPGLKRIEDALEIRRRILTAFERAEATADEEQRKALLTFLIVGGGPTGVELAGAIAELARFGLQNEFRAFDPKNARVILVQSGRRLLPSFPERLSFVAQRSLERLGVEVLLGGRVDQVDDLGVAVDGRRIEARTVLWAAGVSASPAAHWLSATADKSGRLLVEADLRVPGLSNVFGVGDTAASQSWKGEFAPGLAPAAKQGGAYVAKHIRASVLGRRPPSPFRYRHLGSLATIGRKSAIADFGLIRLSGAPAWWLWGLVHVGFMLGVRNRTSTLLNWFWSYLKFGGSIRLITGA